MFIYNSLTRTKEKFEPLDGKTVKIYACGPTPYDFSHLGHARVYIVWDVIQRYLRHIKNYDVTYVRNITDVEDKIINRAKKENTTPEMVARRFTYEFWRDMDSLNVEMPDHEPRASEYINEMIDFIKELIAKGHAYAVDGDVYFNVPSLAEYGQLTRQKLEDMLIGAREQVIAQSELEKRKKHPADFALWKGAEESTTTETCTGKEKGKSTWSSPWGYGRPGWHIECSAMVKGLLGETIDLHGGGEDLQFPHHENELAQSTALHHKPLARFWVHNSFVQVNNEKMSKSLGNFSTIRDTLHLYSADEIRLFILQTHYRNPIEFSSESLQASAPGIQRLVRALECLPQEDLKNQDIVKAKPALNTDYLKQFDKEYCAAIDNDFNTAVAIACLFNLSDIIARTTDMVEKRHAALVLRFYANILGLRLIDLRQQINSYTARQLMMLLIDLRHEAKQKKDYATADRIRAALTKYGINIMDHENETTWEVRQAFTHKVDLSFSQGTSSHTSIKKSP